MILNIFYLFLMMFFSTPSPQGGEDFTFKETQKTEEVLRMHIEDLKEIKENRRISHEEILKALRSVVLLYGVDTAMWVERIWRKETGHFRFGFRQTRGAGMHPWGEKFPWGWKDLKEYWEEHPENGPIGYTYLIEGGTKKRRKYLVFRTPESFALSLAFLLNKRGERYGSLKRAAGSWYSKEKRESEVYSNSLLKIKPSFVLQIIKDEKDRENN